MFRWIRKPLSRRRTILKHRVRATLSDRDRSGLTVRFLSITLCVLLVVAVCAMAVWGATGLNYAVGQRLEHPVYAVVDFLVPNPKQTESNRLAARAATPSVYRWNAFGVTFDRIRSDLKRVYQAAADASSYEDYAAALQSISGEPDEVAFQYLRRLVAQPEDAGRIQFHRWVDEAPLQSEHVVRGHLRELRDPASTADHVVLIDDLSADGPVTRDIPLTSLVRQENARALRGSAAELSKHFPYELRAMVESVILSALGGEKGQPTIVYDADRTNEGMRRAELATPEAVITYERGKPFLSPCTLGSEQIALLKAHQTALREFLGRDESTAVRLRWRHRLQYVGLVLVTGLIGAGILVYTRAHESTVFESPSRLGALCGMVAGAVGASRLLELYWPHLPELMFVPSLLAAGVLVISFSRRYALGASCILAALVTATSRSDLAFLYTLLAGVAVMIFPLQEIRSRTRVITVGVLTALAMGATSAATALMASHDPWYAVARALRSGSCALLAAFLLSGLLPFVEKLFRTATSLTLLEWRDPTRPLLQILAREAPGTYNHSLVLGTLAEAACDRIGANGLLAQVGALYHDVGKITKPDYFTENQEGRTSRHEKLAPSMSLLIILGHVKDGLELARQYRLPRVLHQFIEEHHGTTVVRYFHHIASTKQPHIAIGRHDREVSEAEFRYAGPKPRSRESAVIMLCDGVEGAVRALADPTPGRIEAVVHQMVNDRLNDGQLNDCDLTMKEIRLVEESLMKSLCAIYHGRVAYPKSPKQTEKPSEPVQVSV